MTTRTAIVFVYLAGEPDAVPAGELRLTQLGRDVTSLFIYGTRYLKRPNAIEIATLEPKTNSPEEMANYDRSEYVRWGKVVKAAGLKPE